MPAKSRRPLAWLKTRLALAQNRISVDVYISFVRARGLDSELFSQLSNWAAEAIAHYWSREIDFDDQRVDVVVRVLPRALGALKFKLALVSGPSFARSHNSGLVPACIKFNLRFFGDAALARASFELTAAHEFGHSVLHASAGLRHSWGHKGTAGVLLQRTHKRAPCYPLQGEIDLMCYYNAPRVGLDEQVARSRAAADDVLALVRLGIAEDAQ